ncbi:hypothetical protein CVT24_006810 [Panaeolus cyanescens]|uniref:SH3 domain-containing protein n=1 Tax=Panaeolus cyanescens TaxID=181874 RepID=A0A409VD06_9AGAR|nr:hypothetical protein CVT24_006810 [Panaeolus cyanescens]
MARRLSRKHAARRAESQPVYATTTPTTVPVPQASESSNVGSTIISNGRFTTPTTIAFAVVVSVLSIALFIVIGSWAYRHRKQQERRKRASVFNPAVFSEKKDPFALLPNQHVKADLTPDIHLNNQTTPLSERNKYRPSMVSVTDTEDAVSGDRTPNTASTFRVTNGIASPPAPTTTFPAIPSPIADKQRSLRAKPKSLDISKFTPEELARSPPPSYNLANGGTPGQDVFIPIPPMLPPEKAKAPAMPPTPPVSSSKFHINMGRSSPGRKEAALEDEPHPVTSPARSESFAPKDLEIPVLVTATTQSAKVLQALPITLQAPKSASSQMSGRLPSAASPRLPRMMTVIATYIPNLSDELEVQVGDTVRVLQQYKDGWCFAQQVGKIDAPRGVVPLICLQERQRMLPLSTKSSESSFESIQQWK